MDNKVIEDVVRFCACVHGGAVKCNLGKNKITDCGTCQSYIEDGPPEVEEDINF